MTGPPSLGASWAQALAAKDFEAAAALLHPELDFRAMTPGRVWEAASPAEVPGEILSVWFSPTDEVRELVLVEEDAFADRERVGYRLLVENEDGRHYVEQQAYLTPRDGRIGWMRILCAGYRPAG